MQILAVAARSSYQVSEADSQTREFLKELREEIIALYITVLYTSIDNGNLDLYTPNLPIIFEFIEKTI